MTWKTFFRTSTALFIIVCGMLVSLAASKAAEMETAALHMYNRLLNGERILQTKQYEKPEHPTVYLTFDDGPSGHTEDILNILKEEQIQATFFVLGESVLRHIDTVQRIVSEGHAIGNHTYDHRYESLYSSFDGFWQQVQQTDRILQETVGVQTRLLRAPGGTYTNFDPLYFYYLDQAGYEIYDWTIDSGDSRRRGVPAGEIIENVKNGRLSNEIILLLHDNAGHEETVKALPEIIRYFQSKGYVFKPLSENVRPVHQSIGLLKWDRTYTFEQHEQTLFEMQRFSGKVQEPSEEENDQAESMPSEPESDLSLTLKMENSHFEISNHLLINGRFYVPLRDWNEWLKGSIRWVQNNRSIYEQYGLRSFEWMTSTQMVAMYDRADAVSQRESVLRQSSDLLLHDNRVYVPIRELAQLHDLKIVDFTVSDEHHEVVFKENKLREFETDVSYLKPRPNQRMSSFYTKLSNRLFHV